MTTPLSPRVMTKVWTSFSRRRCWPTLWHFWTNSGNDKSCLLSFVLSCICLPVLIDSTITSSSVKLGDAYVKRALECSSFRSPATLPAKLGSVGSNQTVEFISRRRNHSQKRRAINTWVKRRLTFMLSTLNEDSSSSSWDNSFGKKIPSSEKGVFQTFQYLVFMSHVWKTRTSLRTVATRQS